MNMDDDDFDAAMRRRLRGLPVPEGESIHLPRRDFLRFGIAAATLGVAGWIGLQYQQTPRIVRQAFAHVEEESDLRGMLVHDGEIRSMLGMPATLPGAVQLCKSCVIGGHATWHLNTYLDNLGYVHVLAFKDPISDASGQGHWLGGYWRFVSEAGGTKVLLLGHSIAALDAVSRTI